MNRYYHTYPQRRKPRPNYAKLFNEEDKADFRSFVQNWNADVPELLNWTILDFYKAYKNNGYQLTLALDLQ